MPRVITTLQAMSHPTVVATINLLSEMSQRLQDENDALKKPWVGLTDEEMYEAVRPFCKADSVARSLFDVSKDEYRAIEAKLKEKNK